MLETIVEEALRQAVELLDLDAPRAEAWASDLLALAAETGADGPARLVAALATDGSADAAAALHAIGALDPALVGGIEIAGPPPPWATALGTSVAEGAWLLRARRGRSAVFRFVDHDEARHVITVDLEPGPPETVGEVRVGPGELLDVLEEDDEGIDVVEQDPSVLAARVVAALDATDHPRPSAVANGRLLVARLAQLTDGRADAPSPGRDEIPELPRRDAADDAYALEVLSRALGDPAAPDPVAIAAAAAVLRAAAASDAPLAQWLAASVGPVDLDEPDLDLVLAALAAAVAPARLEPLDADARAAVLVLEWADWLGVAIGLVRAGEGAAADPSKLVDQVNRCPEVTTTIPKSDRERVAWAFSVCTAPWTDLGLVADGRLTELGVATLPRALDRAWNGPSVAVPGGDAVDGDG